jgi:FtsP/CotA-like multicopper oxidase with cupredoxin domain
MTVGEENPVSGSGNAEPKNKGWGAKSPIKVAVVVAIAAVLILAATVTFLPGKGGSSKVTLIDATTIPKWTNQLDGPPPVYVAVPIYDPNTGQMTDSYNVTASEFYQQLLPEGFPQTKVWGYGGLAKDAVTGEALGFVQNSPGPSFSITRGSPTIVKWINNISSPSPFAVDPTLHWANPNNITMGGMDGGGAVESQPFPPGYNGAQYPVALVTHVHGAEVQSTSDGGPLQWFTINGEQGEDYYTYLPTANNSAVYYYPNEQGAATIWYHDHAMGITRLNVMSGLAGFYMISDPNDAVGELLPSGKYDIPLAIQDRNFLSDGSLYFPSNGINPSIHPYWNPEFFGDVIMVNGKVWPNMNVDQGQYRFRLLDGSNARFYNLYFDNGMPFTVIASDGGYLRKAVTVDHLTVAPGERYEILVDFSNITPGTKVVMRNDANGPYPDGDPADPNTTGQIIQFTVGSNKGFAAKALPELLNPTLSISTFPNLPAPTNKRQLTLVEIMGPDGPKELLLDGQEFIAPVSETPVLGSTEEWVIVNPTADTHPIHLHLVQFQIVYRQAFNLTAYMEAWIEANGACGTPGSCSDIGLTTSLNNTTVNVDLTPFLMGDPIAPKPEEEGWKDTIQMNPGEITVIRIRWTQQNGTAYSFDATEGPGYVWHCHILDHEDNEMMRPYYVTL